MQAALMILVFLIFVGLIYRRKINSFVGIPILALAIALIAKIPPQAILNDVVTDGAFRLHQPILTIIFGATLAEIVKRTGLVEVLIRNTAEFAGDRMGVISVLMLLLVSVLFSVLAGLGAIVMVGSIVFPILVSLGISKVLAACIFLLGLSLGGMFNLFNWSLYTDVLKLSQSEVLKFVLIYFPFVLLISVGFVLWNLRKEESSSFKLQIPLRPKTSTTTLSIWAYLTPVVPVALMFIFSAGDLLKIKALSGLNLSIISAMFIGILYGLLTAPKSAGSKSRLLTQSLFKGIESAGPAIALMITIGMLLKSVSHPAVKSILGPSLATILPGGSVGYVLLFAALAPLALYRGPLNIWGMGSGLVVLMKDSGQIPAPAIMAALMAVGQIQGVSDPTNTYNVWMANYLGVDVNRLLKRTLAASWLMAIVGLVLASQIYF